MDIAQSRSIGRKTSGQSQGLEGNNDSSTSVKRRSPNGRRRSGRGQVPSHEASFTVQMQRQIEHKGPDVDNPSPPKKGSLPRPVGGHEKLGTFSGVFVPTSLNVLSILMFLRFGFILGQAGILGIFGMLVASYLINLVTTLSISAIASNGTVRGGGAYYLISRSLGPEFGGSIGVVHFLGFVFSTGMNSVGLIDCLKQNFGTDTGNWAQWLPEGFWWQYLWSTLVLFICTSICLAGSGIFARCSNGLLAVLLVATFSIPLSTMIVKPFEDTRLGLEYTGLSAETFVGNLLPKLTKGAAGSQLNGKENFQDLFGILFPATGGIFAGASMSGDLKYPSKAIPKGTLYGLVLTFLAYTVVILAMAATNPRASLYRNENIIQDTNISGILILLGEFATSFFSCLMGVIGSAKLLQALARDHLVPGLSIFGQGTEINDEPTYAIIMTHIVAQLTMLCDLNQIASFVTMTYLMTFLVTNLACFLLKISSAPNFRPSFHYFNWWTAAAGTVISGATMFFVNGLYATACVVILIVMFLIIHYTSPPKSWGDVSQSLIYHQVRKYLLRLRQEHVKFWRPQILLFVNDPRRQYNLIQFCNSLKKGALFVLGHVIVTQDFGAAVPEARRQQGAWTKYIDFSKVKAFVNIAISPAIEWGSRNIVLSAGLGGMRPNIVVMGFYNLDALREGSPLIDIPSPQHSRPSTRAGDRQSSEQSSPPGYRRRSSKNHRPHGQLPTDTCKAENAISAASYVTILEDMVLRLRINVAIAKGFRDLELPNPNANNATKFIDLWPIQMSAEVPSDGGEGKSNVLTTNFDTYTLILQLGAILNTVPAWKKAYKLRVAVFVEYESDVYEEEGRVRTLLGNLRIAGEVKVFHLASGRLKTYESIVNGNGGDETDREVEEVLEGEEWWQEIQRVRGKRGRPTPTPLFNMDGEIKESNGFMDCESSSEDRNDGTRWMVSGSFGTASNSSGSSDESCTSDSGDDVSAASENDIDDFLLDEESESEQIRPPTPTKILRRRSHGDSLRGTVPPLKSTLRQTALKTAASSKYTPPILDLPPQEPRPSSGFASDSEGPESSNSSTATIRPKVLRQASMGKFSSKPTPMTKVASEDGPGPSIMFSESPNPSKDPHRSNHTHDGVQESKPTTSNSPQPSGSSLLTAQSIPLSFNDLPCRAQHLILNELIRKHSQQTAVVFTTLPSPTEGTGKSEEESISYLSDLEVLCQDLPPVLLVHSNSMTVTMSL
ncbi:MAG: hypothetical protein M1812_000549 [Candelaria pacifica]|nr:MAG: hypothetical protein M1812_000549 [Candelaria pacifica]